MKVMTRASAEPDGLASTDVPRSVSVRRLRCRPLREGTRPASREERAADREPHKAARRDSGEEYPVFQFERNHSKIPRVDFQTWICN
jgi:hypothetical protein